MPAVPFNPPTSGSIINALTGAPYLLARIDRVPVTEQRLDEITAICNEPAVYDWLFRSRLEGKPYARSGATEFFTLGSTFWQNKSHFIFLITTETGEVAAACDIKSSDSDDAEVGYWASSRHRGVMTPAVVQMCAWARQAGFTALTARVKKFNERSARVLLRAGFAIDPSSAQDADYDRFRIQLTG